VKYSPLCLDSIFKSREQNGAFMRKIEKLIAVCSLLFACFLFASQNINAQSSNVWSAAGQMQQPRTGTASASLSDGRILICGGSDSYGVPQASTEIFDPATGLFSQAAPMNVPRANHAAITLNTGDVLVTGGVTSGGGSSDTAEILNIQTGAWTLLDTSLGTGLAKHAMATLIDGNVLIVGGESTTGPVVTLLLFRVSDLSISSVGSLLTGRADAVAAATPDGRVLIAGGTDINGAVLSSTEIFVYSPDTQSGTITAGPNMTYPRTKATATSTYDGVAVIGGNNGSVDLGTAEIFSQWTNALRVVNGASPRSGHIAALLPNNGSILAMGGTGGTAVDLLQPWGNSLAGVFIAGATSTVDHSGGFVSPGNLGTLLAGGGNGASANAAELYWFPTISTDQLDYAPGTPVVMSGVGFQPGETVNLYLREYVNQMLVNPPDYSVTADKNGSFTFMDYAPTPADLGARYHLTASGTTSGLQAQTVFKDNYPKNKLTIAVSPAGGSPIANSVVAGSSNGGSDYISNCTTTAGCTNSSTIGNNSTVYVTATAGTGRLFSSWTVTGAPSGSTCSNGYTGNPCTLVTVTGADTTSVIANFIPTIALTATLIANSKVYDGNTTEPNGNMSCTLTGVHSGDTVTCTATAGNFASPNAGNGIVVAATVTLGGADAGKYTLGGSGTTVSSEAVTGTANITQAQASVSVTPYSVTYDASPHTATGTATGVGSSDLSSGLSLGGTTHTGAGSYASDAWSFHDANGNYADANGTVSDLIKQATPSITVTPYTATYDGSAHTATGTATGINSVTLNAGLVLTGTTHTDAAAYSNDAWTFHDASGNYADASGAVNDLINKATAIIAVTPYTVTYDGHAHTATVASITGVNSETGGTVGTVDVSNTTHTNAGTYSDSWTFTGSTNYNNIAATTISDTINKANATIDVTPYNVTYDGNAHTATAIATGVNSEDLSALLTLGGTIHSDANDYPNDSWSFTGNGNYNASSGTVHDQISKANATVSITPYSATYDGNAHTATGSATGVKGESLSGLNLGGTTHINAATYNDSWTFTDATGNYNNANGTVDDVISKANATVNVTPYSTTYDGNAHTATGTVTGVKGESLSGLDLSPTTHVNADSYSDTWVFTDSTGNYNSTNGTVNDVISKATATVSVTPYNVTFDGNAHTATGSTTGVKGESLSGLNLGGTTHTNAATYDDTWTFSDTTGNYNNASGTVQDLIKQANASIVVTPYSVTYDGNAHTATATATGISGVDLIADLLLTGTNHTNAGTYAIDPWIFHDANGNYADASGTVSDLILKADQAALTLNAASPLTYSQSELLSASGGTTNGALTYNLVSGSCTVSGNQLTADNGTGSCILTATMAGNSNYKDVTSAQVSVTLAKANQAALTLNAASPLTYNQKELLSVSGGTTAGTVIYNLISGSCTISGSQLTASSGTGSCLLTAIMVGNGNYNDVTSGQIAVTLAKANATVGFSNVGPFVFDGIQHAPNYVVNGVNSEVLTSSAIVSYNGKGSTIYSSSSAPINTGSYQETVAFAGNNNYNALSPSATEAFAITYGFVGLGAPYAPPPTTFNVTRTMPLVWQYTNASGAVVNSAGANPVVQISGPYTCGQSDTGNDITVSSAGASGYQYNSTSNTWQFNWQVKGNAPGCYNIYIVSGQTGQTTGPFPIQVVSH
jgi:hypothetical protein